MRYVQHVSRSRISYVAREYWFELLIGAMGIAVSSSWWSLAGRADQRRCGSRCPRWRSWCCRSSRAAGFPSPLRPRTGFWRRPHLCRRPADHVHRTASTSSGLASGSSSGTCASEGWRRSASPSSSHHYDRGLQHPRPPARHGSSSSPSRFVVSWVAGYALRERSEQAEAAEEPRGPRRARARFGRTRRGGRGAVADRARAPRHRRPRRQRDGAPGRRRPAQAPRCAGRGPRSAQGRRAGWPHGACRDAPSPGCHAPRRGRGRTLAPARPRRPRLTAGRDRPGRLPVELHVDGEPFPLREGSTSLPIASSRRA